MQYMNAYGVNLDQLDSEDSALLHYPFLSSILLDQGLWHAGVHLNSVYNNSMSIVLIYYISFHTYCGKKIKCTNGCLLSKCIHDIQYTKSN